MGAGGLSNIQLAHIDLSSALIACHSLLASNSHQGDSPINIVFPLSVIT